VATPPEQRMIARNLLHGAPTPDKIGRPVAYYDQRDIFLDCRGSLKIHPNTNWGWQVMVLTRSHNVTTGEFGPPVVNRPVTVDEGAWICSRALLYNCHIEHHAIVACGAVVRNTTVPPYTIVEGNPAVPTRHFENGHWVPVERVTSEV